MMKKIIARILKWVGFKPCYSTGVHGGITAGYGKLDALGYWEYKLDCDDKGNLINTRRNEICTKMK